MFSSVRNFRSLGAASLRAHKYGVSHAQPTQMTERWALRPNDANDSVCVAQQPVLPEPVHHLFFGFRLLLL